MEWVQHSWRDAPTVCLAPFKTHGQGLRLAPGAGVLLLESDPSGQRPRMLGHEASDSGQVSALPKNSSVTLDKLR